jgi:hypothetical protein
MESKITGGHTTLLFEAKVLSKYDVKYYRCNDTGFIQTEEPYWLDEAYSSAITRLDIGLPYRNIQMADRVSRIILNSFNSNRKFLDYAGGYGLFTRLMRDKGFDYFNTDKYCQNMFAEHFDLQDLPANTLFELTTAFEVFEHLVQPAKDAQEMLSYADHLLFTTELQPAEINTVNDWWYFAPETGQHIAFYNEDSLAYLAKQAGYNFFTDGQMLHLFTKKQFDKNPLVEGRDSFLLRKAKKYVRKMEQAKYRYPESRLMKDYEFIKSKMQ